MGVRLLFAIAVLVVLSGCTSYQQQDLAEPTAKLERGGTVAISTPADGRYGNTIYPASGLTVANAIKAAFAYHSHSTAVVDCQAIACLEEVAADYLVVPEILHWEDRATEWSGRPDRIKVKIAVFDAAGQELASSIISGRSRRVTFGRDHPQNLLPEPVGKFVNALY